MKRGVQFVVGGIILSVDGYAADTLKRSTNYNHAANKRLLAETAHQFVGLGVESLTLSGTANHLMAGRMYELDALRAVAKTGKPVTVTTGTGQNMGLFVIIKIDDGYSQLMDDHRAIINGWSIELKSYGVDYAI